MNNITFENSNGQSPVDRIQDFVYLAQYKNGKSTCEFDPYTKKKNDFYKIDRMSLDKFGLIGQGMKLFFDVDTGIFNLNGHQVMFSYKTKEKEYMLTGHNARYNDIITYKDAYTDANIINPNQKYVSHIHQYNFGYKVKLGYANGVELNFQVICSLPYNKPAFMQIKLVSNTDLDGEMYIKRVGNITESIKAPLKQGYSGNCQWIIR